VPSVKDEFLEKRGEKRYLVHSTVGKKNTSRQLAKRKRGKKGKILAARFPFVFSFALHPLGGGRKEEGKKKHTQKGLDTEPTPEASTFSVTCK
jgi:hypothetical protein